MNGTLLRLMVRRHRLAIGLCLCVPLLLGVVIGFLYPTFSKERALARSLAGFLNFVGQGQIDMLTARGGFTLVFQHPLVLLTIAVAAAIPATAWPAGERGRGGLDLLLATPLTRGTLVRTCGALVVGAALAFGLSTLVGASVGALIAGATSEVPWPAYLAVAANVVAVACCFGMGALWISVAAEDRGVAAMWFGTAAALALILDITARLWKTGAWLRWTTPYGLLRPAAAVAQTGHPWLALRDASILGGLALAFGLGAVLTANRRRSA